MALVAGLDLGSTWMKILIADESLNTLFQHSERTPWRHEAEGTYIDSEQVKRTVAALLETTQAWLGDRSVVGVGISGMGETGFVTDRSGNFVAPGFAWFDSQGSDAVAALDPQLIEAFPGVTGLPWGVQVSVVKLLLLTQRGLDLAGRCWLSLPEAVAHMMGAPLVAERSLISRTGLIDQTTGELWSDIAEVLGADRDFIPDVVQSGAAHGTADASWIPSGFRSALITVAGHDHLVSAAAAGGSEDRYHVSMGTAEVLVRTVDSPLTFEARQVLGRELINCVQHVVPGKFAIVAGVKTGLIMRRLLEMFGITGAQGRQQLDDAVMALGQTQLPSGAINIAGARNDDGVLQLRIGADGASPAELFLAALEHGNQEILRLIEVMDRYIPPTDAALMCGGWTTMRSVLAARTRILPDLRVSEHEQETAFGAAKLAAELTASC